MPLQGDRINRSGQNLVHVHKLRICTRMPNFALEPCPVLLDFLLSSFFPFFLIFFPFFFPVYFPFRFPTLCSYPFPPLPCFPSMPFLLTLSFVWTIPPLPLSFHLLFCLCSLSHFPLVMVGCIGVRLSGISFVTSCKYVTNQQHFC